MPELAYVSSPGMPRDPEGRKRQGLSVPGDSIVITDMAVFRFKPATGRMFLSEIYPGISPEDVTKEVGFEIETDACLPLPPPRPEELRLLRERIDPLGLIIKQIGRS